MNGLNFIEQAQLTTAMRSFLTEAVIAGHPHGTKCAVGAETRMSVIDTSIQGR